MSCSASKAERWLKCPASEALPHSVEEAGPAAERGKQIHAFLQRALEHGRDAALINGDVQLDPEVRTLCEAIPLEELPQDPAQYAAEVWLGWHPGTGESFALSLDGLLARRMRGDTFPEATAALDREGCIFGAADVVAVDEGQKLGLVVDYKTGFAERPQDSAQLRCLAVLLAKAKGLTAVDGSIIRILPDGSPYRMVHRFGEQELQDAATELARGRQRVDAARTMVGKGQTPKTYQGNHCRFCAAFSSCPGKVGLIRILSTSPDTVEAEALTLLRSLSPPDRGAAHLKIDMIVDLAERLKKADREACLELGDAPLGDGRVWGPREKSLPPVYDFDKTAAALDTWRDSAGGAGMERRYTKGSLDGLARLVAANEERTIKAVAEEIESVLDRAGAVERKFTTEVRERRG